MKKKYINRSLIISLIALASAIILLVTIRSIYSGVAGAQTPTAEEAALDSQTARRVKGEVYYDIKFSTDRISRGKEKRFDITVTAFNGKTGLVDKNPFQRVKLMALPVARSNDLWTAPGTFTSNDSSRPSPYAEHVTSYPRASAGLWPISAFDLIEGIGEVSFSATNTPETDNYIGFVVTPISWTDLFDPRGNSRSHNANRYTLQTPRRPAGYTFLYKQWQVDNTMAKHIFTIATLPVGGALSQSMTELGSWQKPASEQPQNDTPQNIVVPPAANLAQPIYDEDNATKSSLYVWLWAIGSLIALVVLTLGWLAIKNRSRKAK